MQKINISGIFIFKHFGLNLEKFYNCGNSGHTSGGGDQPLGK